MEGLVHLHSIGVSGLLVRLQQVIGQSPVLIEGKRLRPSIDNAKGHGGPLSEVRLFKVLRILLEGMVCRFDCLSKRRMISNTCSSHVVVTESSIPEVGFMLRHISDVSASCSSCHAAEHKAGSCNSLPDERFR
jgi:hypothetical protein